MHKYNILKHVVHEVKDQCILLKHADNYIDYTGTNAVSLTQGLNEILWPSSNGLYTFLMQSVQNYQL